MHKKWQIGAAIVTVALLTVGLAGCGKKAANKSTSKSAEPVPAGVYKTSTRDGQDKSGHQYWYFASDGKLYYYTAGDKPNPGKALTGSWKKGPDQRYQFLLGNTDNNQSTELTANLKGKQITVKVKNKGDQLSWTTVTGSRQANTSKAEFMKQFNNAKSSAQDAKKTSESQQSASGSSASANSASSSSTGVHLTGGQSSVDYITQKMGDQGWVVDSGTYGGAHGAPTDGSYVPYNTVRNDKGDMYQVFQDGRIQPFGN